MDIQNPSQDTVIKLKWTARILSLASGFVLVLLSILDLTLGTDILSNFSWVKLFYYPIAIFLVWRWSFIGGLFSLIAIGMVQPPGFLLVLNIAFIIAGFMSILVWYWQQQIAGDLTNNKTKPWKKWLGVFISIAVVGFAFGPESVPEVGGSGLILTMVGTRFNPILWFPYFAVGRHTSVDNMLFPVTSAFLSILLFISTIVYWALLSFLVILLYDRLPYWKQKWFEKVK